MFITIGVYSYVKCLDLIEGNMTLPLFQEIRRVHGLLEVEKGKSLIQHAICYNIHFDTPPK